MASLSEKKQPSIISGCRQDSYRLNGGVNTLAIGGDDMTVYVIVLRSFAIAAWATRPMIADVITGCMPLRPTKRLRLRLRGPKNES